MVFDSNFERFISELLKQNSTQYVSLSSYTQQRLQQINLHEIYTPVEIIQIIHYRIRNVDRPKRPIQNPPIYTRRVCLKVLSELKQLHIGETTTKQQASLSFVSPHSQYAKILYLALVALNASDRQILFLRHTCGMSWAEIAHFLVTSDSMQQSSTFDLQQRAEQALERLRRLYQDLTDA